MSKRSAVVLLEDMLEAIGDIQEFTQGMTFEDFCQNNMCISAVVRKLEIVGEVARLIPEETQLKGTDIPWRKIRGMRNRIIHEYFDVSLSIVWQVVTKDLVPLKAQVETLLEQIKYE